jgi:two-component system LytT family response regulator
MIRTVIIEDEQEDMDLMHNLLAEHPAIQIVATAKDIENGIAVVSFHKPDLLFLDINLYRRLSFEILNVVSTFNLNTKVVFTTAYNEFMENAFKYSAFDYLLKPIDRGQLADTIVRYQTNCSSENFRANFLKLQDAQNKLVFNTIDGYTVVNPREIVFMETEKNQGYTDIWLCDNTLVTVTKSIGEVYKNIDNEVFIKLHRSFVLNIEYVEKVNRLKRKCYLKCRQNHFEIPVSHEKAKMLKNILDKNI